MQDSVFTKILKKEFSGEVVYQDKACFSILSVEPHNPGHLLLIPKEQIADWQDVDKDTWSHMMLVAQDLAGVIKKVYDAPKIALALVGFDVPHVHIHIFSLFSATDIDSNNAKATDIDELKRNADKIRLAIQEIGVGK